MATVNAAYSGGSVASGGLVAMATVNAAYSGGSVASGGLVASVGVPPLAPALLTPANQSTADLTTQAFTWVFTSPQGLTQSGYALRFTQQGGSGAWQWYDASSGGLVSTETENLSTAQTATPGSAALSNGSIYSWQVAVWDTTGTRSPYSASYYVTGSAEPSVTVTAPSGTQSAGQVTLVWVNGNVTQVTSYQVVLYTAAQTQAGGFSPGSSPWVWNSGVILGSGSSILLPAVSPGSYVAYVQIDNSLGQTSAWASWDLAYSYTQPSQPTLTATWQASSITTALVVSGVTSGNLVSVYRSLDNGSTWSVVSSFNQVTATSSTVTGADYTPLPSQESGALPNIDYYAVQIGSGNLISPRSTTEVVTPVFPTPTGSVPFNGWNFADGGTDFKTAYTPMITKFTQSQAIRGGLHQVLGQPYQIQTYDVVEGRTLKFEAVSLAVDDWLALRAMLQSAHQFYITNVYGLVGFFAVDPKGYSEDQEIGSVAATIRHVSFTMTEYATLPSEGAGT